MRADMIIYNGNVITMDLYKPFATAVVIADERIVKVCEDEEALTYRGEETKLLDAEGNTVTTVSTYAEIVRNAGG